MNVGQTDEKAVGDATEFWRKRGGGDEIKEINELYPAKASK